MKTEKQLLKEYIQYVLDSYKLNEALEVHGTLNPVLWENNQLKEDVKQALIDIANNFIKNLGFPIDVVDIRFLGSNASYNYNSQSDIDLHIITNFGTNYIDDSILQQLYNNEKNSFNNKHDISVKGIPVEIYIEDMKSMNATNGSYSLLQDKWIKTPEPIDYAIPDYSKELDEELSKAQDILANATSSQEIKDEINHIYLMRKDGLSQDGEASIGNLVFKELRNMGIQSELAAKYYELESNELSLESEDLTESKFPVTSDKEYTKNELLDIVRKADKYLLYYLIYNFEELGYYREDKRSGRKFVLNCIENCYDESSDNHYDIQDNKEIRDAILYSIDLYNRNNKKESLKEMVYYNDVTPTELNNNPVNFTVYGFGNNRSEYAFNNMKELFKYVNECGGFNSFKGLKWFISSNYKDGEFYYIRDKFSKGGWHWEDYNGAIVKGTESRKVRSLKNLDEYHDYMNLNPKISSDDYDLKCVEYWKEQIQKGNHRPILINKDNEILDGNHTMTAYQELNIEPPKVYLGDRAEFYKHVAATKTIDAIDAINDMINDGTAELLEDYDPGYGLSRAELISRLKKLNKNYNFNRFETSQLYHIYNKEQKKKDETSDEDDFLNSDEYKELISQPKQKHVYYDASYDYDESNEAKDEIRKQYNESEQLNEYNLKDVLDDSKANDPKRIELSKSLYTEYKGVDSDGTLIFETDSQTRSGLGHKQRIFYSGFFDLLDKVDQNESITDEDVVNILTGDLMLDCSCESFLYWAWAYKSWKEEYGLKKETRAPKRNNVNLKGGACKHCLSVLELINRSNSIFDQIAKDLNDLFQHYKKKNPGAGNRLDEPNNETITDTK